MSASASAERAPRAAPSPDDWRAIMVLLDSALELEPEDHARWLDTLEPKHERLRPTLEELLREHREPDPNALASWSAKAAPDWLADVAQPGPQSRVGPYRLLKEIGRGGMATVWLAERADGLLDRPVALKLPHVVWGGDAFAVRLERERRILASLTHPHIARLYDVGTAADGRPFLALQHVEGVAIDDYAARHGLDVASRIGLVVQVARAVAYAHAQLVVHRDLKPSNILVDEQGEAHLLDFGVAKLIDGADGDDGGEALTKAQGRALTLDYASPEQIRGEAIGTASDTYSLGIVLYELLAGTRPYRLSRDLGPAALVQAIADVVVPRPSEATADAALGRRLAGDLDAIVGRALAKASGERYATIAAFADDLERHLRGEAVHARPDSRLYRLDRWVRRHKVETAVAAAVLVAIPAGAAAQAAVVAAIGIGAGVALWQLRSARAQARRATDEARRAEEVKHFTLSIFLAANTDSGADASTTAADVLKAAQSRIETDLAGQPAIAVELMNVVGDGLHGLGEHDVAERAMRHAVALGRAHLGTEHPHTARAMVVHGAVLVELDRSAEAQPLLERAAATARRRGWASVLVDALRWLSTCRLSRGDMERAVADARAAVDVAVADGSSASGLDRVRAWGSYANALLLAQRPGVADAARRSLECAEKLYGNRINETIIFERAILARGLGMEDRDAEALAVLDSTLADMIRLFGSDYPRIEAMMNFRGHIRVDCGDAAGAIDDFHAQIAATRRKSGDAGGNLAMGYSSLGKALAAARIDDEALEAYETAARLLREAPEGNRLHEARALSVRASVLVRLGRIAEADEAMGAIPEGWWAGSDAEAAMHASRLGLLRSAQGRHDEAIALAKDAVARLGSTGPRIPVAQVLSACGRALLAAGLDGEAVAPLAEAVRLFDAKQLHPTADRADAAAALARAESKARADAAGATP